MSALPDPRLTLVYRLEATLGEPLDLGEIAQGHRRIVPLTVGTFTGPEINGILVTGASADRQIETAAPALDWVNEGIFIGVGGRQPGGVIYETYLVA